MRIKREILHALPKTDLHTHLDGVRLIEDPELMRYVNDHRIPLEVCLTSNIQTDAVDTFEDHPFKTYLARGLRVTLNTDSRTVSNTTVTDEYLRAVEHYNLSLTDIRQLIINGFKSAFMSYEDKSTMLKKAIAEVEKILYEQELKVEKGI
jgi:adenosine deaminase